ncbi:motile sperm domain-containing protein 2-like [Ornithodoros turicata]|uniref:motile sperm domain-containing protein 2-like n=1 Tax=Ornithodoros turicata TaxID=34597 RepID=UPI003139F0BC
MPFPDMFGESRYCITSEHMKAFRSRLLTEIPKADRDRYHPSDLQKVKQCDEYCWRFIVHNRLDLQRALRMANTALLWRADIKVHDITELSLPKVYFQLGFIYPYNLDRYGNHVLVFSLKDYVRNALVLSEAKRFVVFFVERLFSQYNTNRITLLLDCEGVESRNIDVRLLKFLCIMFRSYYPRSLGFILLRQAPWMFVAAWKIVKGLLPIEAIERVRFVTTDELTNYIEKEKLPRRMGGTDSYEYDYKPGFPMGDRCPRLPPLNTVSCTTTTLNVYGMFTA